jgi:outer membrane protein TolC
MRTLAPTVTIAVLLAIPATASALQPLEAFVKSSRTKAFDNREAVAIERQRDAQHDVATAALLPTFTAQGTYTRNQYGGPISLPGGNATLTLMARDGLDAYLTVAVPLVDIGAWEKRSAAEANLAVASASRANTELTVETTIARAYYQLLADNALVFSAQKSLEATGSNRRTVSDKKELGTASDLDLQRAIADVAAAQQDLATAEQAVLNDIRNLETLSGLAPEPVTRASFVEDDLRDEGPLTRWLTPSSSDLVPVRAAIANTTLAERNRAAARAAWFPVLSAQGQERFTNAGGFTGRTNSYTLTANLTWRFDFGLAPNVSAQTAALAAARAREDKARRGAEDAIYQAWTRVQVGLEKVRASRARGDAATAALGLARDRYESGIATQLEVIQAQRDFFTAQVARVQADADLQYARVLLHLNARRAKPEG